MRQFSDRRAAGRELARVLLTLLSPSDSLFVLGLPRGGVPVAAEVALALGRPLDVLPVRKISAPGDPEVAIGAIASGKIVVKEDYQRSLVSDRLFQTLLRREQAELARRERTYRGSRGPLLLDGLTALLVDDGIATGDTMLAAIRAARAAGAIYVIAAVPVASSEAARRIEAEADQFVVLDVPSPFIGVGASYQHFEQLKDSDVAVLLERHSL